jgi:hypothetical protein
MVRYKVKPDQADRNRELVRAVYAELARVQPANMRYATFELDDGVSFVHIHSNDVDGENPLEKIAAFAAFQENIKERLEEGPVVTELREVGSYRFFGESKSSNQNDAR